MHRGEFLCSSAGQGEADAGRTSLRARLFSAIQRLRARRTAPSAGQRNWKSRLGVGAGRRSPRVSFRGCRYVGEWGAMRVTRSGQRPGFNYRRGGNRVAWRSVQLAAIAGGLPEQIESTAPLPLLGRSREAATGACGRLQPQDEDCEAGWTAPLVNRMGVGIRVAVLFLSAASVVMAMRRWIRVPRLGLGYQVKRTVRSRVVVPAGAAGAKPAPTPQPGLEQSAAKRSVPDAWQRRRSTSATWQTSDERSSQFQASDGCPATGGISSEPLNGARREKDLNTPPPDWTGNEGLKHPANPARAACRELRQIRSGSIPSWADPSGERIIRQVIPGLKGDAPKISMAGNLGKA